MRRLAALLAAWLLAGTAQAAAPCAMAEEPVLPPARLALAKAAVAKAGRLVILGIGGAPMAGAVAQDPALTYLARLQAHLRVAMPALQVEVVNHAVPRRATRGWVRRLSEELAETRPGLVLWEGGAREAAMGVDLGQYAAALEDGIGLVQAARSDLILIDTQFAPRFVSLVNVAPYRDIMLATAAGMGVPVFPRFALMTAWSGAGVLDLEAGEPAAQLAVTRQLFDCLGDRLALMIAAGLK